MNFNNILSIPLPMSVETVDYLTVKINNRIITDEILFYIKKFCHLIFDKNIPHNIDCLIDSDTISMEINCIKSNAINFPKN